MTCTEATRLIGPWLDDELDVRSIADVESHVARCAACGRERKELLALRETARERLPRFDPPAALEERLLRAVRRSAQARTPRTRRWARDVSLVAAAACAAALVVAVLPGRGGGGDELVDAHLRSLQPGHLTDVTSSDQHSVKPWFQGKIDFAVPARDFSDAGFALVGGRLDVAAGRPAAALVYRRRQHLLNVFVWAAEHGESPPRTSAARGYRVTRWSQGGLEYALVSDVPAAEADRLADLLRNG